eukprot:scaffold14544_cov103-Skeletonema_dohrnii-CCMP3373.AAC.1
MADMHEGSLNCAIYPSILSLPIIMGHWKLLIAIITAIDTIWELEPCNISFYTIITNHNGPLEAVDCDNHCDRYDMVRESCRRPSQIGPHQVTYDAVA